MRNCCVNQLLKVPLVLDLFDQHVLRDILDLNHGLLLSIFCVVFDLNFKVLVGQREVFVSLFASLLFNFDTLKFQVFDFAHLFFLFLSVYIRDFNYFENFRPKNVGASVLLRNVY